MQVAVDWKSGLGFSGSGPSGIALDLSGDAEHSGFGPMELMAFALAGCTGMDVISILQKKRQPVSGFQVRVNTQRRDEHPRGWTHVLVEYIVTGAEVDPAAVERAIELSTEKYCPANYMLKQAVEIETKYEIRPS
ncbi:MAG: OsmC family protein [Anaerolineales bacterium]|nr:OsmC family protein [Anaerolineales bacterium]